MGRQEQHPSLKTEKESIDVTAYFCTAFRQRQEKLFTFSTSVQDIFPTLCSKLNSMGMNFRLET